jgi:hypothetical protein
MKMSTEMAFPQPQPEVMILNESSRRHLEFALAFEAGGRRWDQNRQWQEDINTEPPEIKVIFGFNRTNELNESPFVTKFADDVIGECAYFGVAYASQNELEGLSAWASKFPDAKLLTYSGSFIGRITNAD